MICLIWASTDPGRAARRALNLPIETHSTSDRAQRPAHPATVGFVYGFILGIGLWSLIGGVAWLLTQ